ncbi:hypothetical protein ACJX0J_013186, partial [Zea mays]
KVTSFSISPTFFGGVCINKGMHSLLNYTLLRETTGNTMHMMPICFYRRGEKLSLYILFTYVKIKAEMMFLMQAAYLGFQCNKGIAEKIGEVPEVANLVTDNILLLIYLTNSLDIALWFGVG